MKARSFLLHDDGGKIYHSRSEDTGSIHTTVMEAAAMLPPPSSHSSPNSARTTTYNHTTSHHPSTDYDPSSADYYELDSRSSTTIKPTKTIGNSFSSMHNSFSTLDVLLSSLTFPIDLAGSDDMIDIVWDLDGTLVYLDLNLPLEYKTMLADVYPHETIEMKKTRKSQYHATSHVHLSYKLAYGSYEVLHCLLQYSYIRMSFFSAGEAWRNEKLIPLLFSQLKSRYDRQHAVTFANAPSPKEHFCHEKSPSFHVKKHPRRSRVSSWFHALATYLNILPNSFTLQPSQILSRSSLSGHGLKDLRLVSASDLSRIILIDDQWKPHPGQEKNLLRLAPGLGDFHPYRSSEEEWKIHCNLIRCL